MTSGLSSSGWQNCHYVAFSEVKSCEIAKEYPGIQHIYAIGWPRIDH